ncbi:MAG: DUF222 domain-containing protein [Ilumatobacteraceae bacterium]
MSSFVLPDATAVAAMSAADREAFVRSLDRERRRAEAQVAAFVHTVAAVGAHLADGHRTPGAWGRAACNWSNLEAGRFVKAGATLARFSSAATVAQAGNLGVAQLHALSSVVTNQRLQEHLDEGEQLLVGSATTLDYPDYLTFLHQWSNAADPDGAHQSAERAHRNRRARLGVIGNVCFLDAVGGATQGVQLREILDAFAHSEWLADWEVGVLTHGDGICPALLDRTDAQRRFDALVAIFHAAAGMSSDATGTGVTVNVLVGVETFEHHLEKALGGDPDPVDPNDPLARCETDSGTPIDPYDMLIAAATGHVRRIVLDSAGVVVDTGRRQRLFTGPLREAVLLMSRRCVWPGCHQPANACQADHVLPWSQAGPSRTTNGAPVCGHHNRWKSRGYRTLRDPNGHWHHYRPDGTEIGWRTDACQSQRA